MFLFTVRIHCRMIRPQIRVNTAKSQWPLVTQSKRKTHAWNVFAPFRRWLTAFEPLAVKNVIRVSFKRKCLSNYVMEKFIIKISNKLSMAMKKDNFYHLDLLRFLFEKFYSFLSFIHSPPCQIGMVFIVRHSLHEQRYE